MNRIVFTLWVWLFPAACTALGAAGVFLLRRQTRPATRRILCGMAAGIMLAASVWSLLLPAIARSEGRAAWVPPALGLILGAVGLLRLEDAAGQLLAGGPGHCGRMVLAVTLHNLPEGMVVGLAAALALHGDADAVSGALALSLGIGLQNIPEGAAVSLPLTQSGRTRGQSFAAGAASGLVEPLGAVLAFVLAEWVGTALPWLMSAAAGCMVNKLDGIEVNFNGTYNTLVIRNLDYYSSEAAVTTILSQFRINIANMSLYRSRRGGAVLMVIETDQVVPPVVQQLIDELPGVAQVTCYEKGED